METQQIGIFSNKEDKEKFDKWTKEDIYKAYLLENTEKIRLNQEVNRLGRKIAEIRFATKSD